MQRLVIALFLTLFAHAAFAQEVGNYTNMSKDPFHGTQVEYLSDDGRTYLWYPGNRSILQGRWKREGDGMCFAYGANTYNPATGQSGGGWECMPFRLFWGSIEQRMPGDILGLASRTEVPFVLEKRRTTLDKLLARVSPNAEAPPFERGALVGDQEIVLSCANILANAENGEAGAHSAISTYFYGTFMGKHCVDVDYDKAYALAQKAGISFEPWAKVLRERAEGGHPRAVAAVKRLGL
jgi:hypothetical protein